MWQSIRAPERAKAFVHIFLRHELAHAYLHYDKGNIVDNKNQSYEEQADRAANMLLETIQITGGAQG